MGHTHIRVAAASEDVLKGALQTAWKLRVEKNVKTRRKKAVPAEHNGATDIKRTALSGSISFLRGYKWRYENCVRAYA
jgi:hypothetical protein